MFIEDIQLPDDSLAHAGAQEFAIIIVIGFVLFTILLFVYSHLSRYVTYLKLKEGKYIDDQTFDAVYNFARFIGVVFSLLLLLMVGSTIEITEFTQVLEIVTDYLFILMAVVTLFAFVLAAKLSSSWISVKREEAEEDPAATVKPRMLEFLEVFTKYSLYIFGLFIAILVGILTTPNETIRSQIFDALGFSGIDGNLLMSDLVSLAIILVVLYLIFNLISVMLDDFKKKSTKFPARLIDLIKALVRYLLYWLAFVITLMVILGILGFPYLEMVIFIVVAITLSAIFIVGASSSTKNAISGIVLLLTDSINKGDWVKLGEETTGEVLEQGLIFTRVRTQFGDVMDIPNEKVLGNTIHNFTTIDGLRLDIDISVSLDTPSALMEETIIEACSDVEGIDRKYDISVRLMSISRDAALYCVHVWVLKPSEGDDIRSNLLKKFHEKMTQKGIILGPA